MDLHGPLRITGWNNALLAWLLWWPVATAHALDIPLSGELPYELAELRDLVGQQPSLCIKRIDDYLAGLSPPGERPLTLDNAWQASPNRPELIGLLQLKAACLAKSERGEEALQTLQYAQFRAADLDNPLVLIQVLLSQSLIHQHLRFDNDQAEDYLDKALEELQKMASPLAIPVQAELELQRCDLLLSQKRLLDAKVCLSDALENARHANDPRQISRLLILFGQYYRWARQPEMALFEYTEAKSLAQEHDLAQLVALCNLNQAQTYLSLNETATAVEYANLAAQQFQQWEDYERLQQSLSLLGQIHEQDNESNLALVYYFNALDIARQLDQRYSLSALYLKMAKNYLQMGNLSVAKNYLDTALKQADENHYREQQIEALSLLGQLYLQRKQTPVALTHLEKALHLASGEEDLPTQQALYKLLAKAYEAAQSYQLALDAYKAYVALSEQQPSPQSNAGKDTFRQQYQLVEQHEQIDRLTRESNIITATLEKTRLYGVIFFGTSLLMGLMWVNKALSLKAANTRIAHQQRQLTHHPLTRLPNRRALIHWLRQEHSHNLPRPVNASGDADHQGNEGYLYSLLLFELPMLDEAKLQRSPQYFRQLCQELGKRLATKLTTPDQSLYQLGRQRLLLVTHHEYQPCAKVVEQASGLLRQLAREYQLNDLCYCGVVETPFLSRAPDAIEPDRLVQLCELALFGSRQLPPATNSLNWVRLYANNHAQGASFSGDIWRSGIRAIQRGIVRVECSGDKHRIIWPELNKGGITDENDTSVPDSRTIAK